MTKHAVKSVDLIFCHRLSSFCWSYRHAASFYPQCSWENGASNWVNYNELTTSSLEIIVCNLPRSKFVNGDFEDIEHSSESDVVHMPFLQA